jgi:hypothetical protein
MKLNEWSNNIYERVKENVGLSQSLFFQSLFMLSRLCDVHCFDHFIKIVANLSFSHMNEKPIVSFI